MADEKVTIVRLPFLKPILWNPGGHASGFVVRPARTVAEKSGGGVSASRLKNAGGL